MEKSLVNLVSLAALSAAALLGNYFMIRYIQHHPPKSGWPLDRWKKGQKARLLILKNWWLFFVLFVFLFSLGMYFRY